jgi:predicted nucleotidyltransferase
MDNTINILKQHKEHLFNKYPITNMALFGSRSRDDFKEDSDVDILIEISGKMGFEFLHLNYELEEILHKKVDLISKRGLKPAFINFIEQDLIYV